MSCWVQETLKDSGRWRGACVEQGVAGCVYANEWDGRMSRTRRAAGPV